MVDPHGTRSGIGAKASSRSAGDSVTESPDHPVMSGLPAQRVGQPDSSAASCGLPTPPRASPPPKRDNTQWVILTVAVAVAIAVVIAGGLLCRVNSRGPATRA